LKSRSTAPVDPKQSQTYEPGAAPGVFRHVWRRRGF
jgi:hypothetical protein